MGELFDLIKASSKTISLLSPPPEIDKYLFDKYPALEQIYHDGYCEEDKLRSAEKMLVSVLHSVVMGQKLVFGMTRDNFMKIVSMDVNWDNPVGETKENYAKVLGMLQKIGVRRLATGTKNKAGILYVDETSFIRESIRGNFDEHLLATWDFVKPFKNSIVDSNLLAKYPGLSFQ